MDFRECLVSVDNAMRDVVVVVEACLLNFRDQTYPDIEMIVTDGGPGAVTLKMLKRFTCRFDRVSQGGPGGNETRNKGARSAARNWLYFLGVDDCLVGQIKLERLFEACPGGVGDYGVLTAHVLNEDEKSRRSDRCGLLRMNGGTQFQEILYQRRLFEQQSFNPRLRVQNDNNFRLWPVTFGNRFWSSSALLRDCIEVSPSQNEGPSEQATSKIGRHDLWVRRRFGANIWRMGIQELAIQ